MVQGVDLVLFQSARTCCGWPVVPPPHSPVYATFNCLRVCMNPLILPPPLTEHKAELDGLLFDVGVGLGDVGAAPAEGVCQN